MWSPSPLGQHFQQNLVSQRLGTQGPQPNIPGTSSYALTKFTSPKMTVDSGNWELETSASSSSVIGGIDRYMSLVLAPGDHPGHGLATFPTSSHDQGLMTEIDYSL